MDNIPFPTVPYPRMEPPAHREKTMKVLALGMSRTGTMSLYVALKELGYTCYHMAECNLDQQNNSLLLWSRAIDAKFNGNGRKFAGADFDQMLWRYDAVTDIPCILFAEELMDAYPDARIILTTRPVEPWLASMQRTFYAILSWKRWRILEFIDQTYIGLYIPILRSALSVWTKGNWQDASRLPIGFAAHYDLVRIAAKKRGREVLEFKVQDGWGPLCQFLGKEKEKPDHPFPHVNEAMSHMGRLARSCRDRDLVVVVPFLNHSGGVSCGMHFTLLYLARSAFLGLSNEQFVVVDKSLHLTSHDKHALYPKENHTVMRILDLPVEVLLLIYQSLNDIDDALHLARTCEQLYAIFDSLSSRVNIFRCIIQAQCQHMYDIKLTILQSHNQRYISSLGPSMGHEQKASRPGPNVLSQVLFPTHPHRLSDEQVWAIVCRWHGMRALFALYSDPIIHNIYVNDWVPWWHTRYPILLGNSPLPQLSDQIIHSTPDQKRILYHRFYQALTSHWLSIECLALAKATVYPTRTSRNQWHKIISAQWYGGQHLPLREKLDILHVTVFVWEFLARKAFEAIPLIPRLQEFRTRKVLLRPPNVIQAVILQNWPDPDSMCDLMEYFEHLTPEYTIQQAIAGDEHEGDEEPGNLVDENAGAWDMGLQDLEKCTHDYLRQVKTIPRATWRWYWPASWGGSFGKRPRLGHPGDGRLSISVLDKLFLCPETDELLLVEMLYGV